MPRQPGFFSTLRRATDDRVVAGLAAGTARSLGVDPGYIRAGFVVLTLAFGLGLAVYLAGWATTRDDGGTPQPTRVVPGRSLLGLALAGLGVLLVLRGIGLWPGDWIMFPATAVAFGLALIWDRSDPPWRTRARVVIAGEQREQSLLRTVVGAVLLIAGLALFARRLAPVLGLPDLVLAGLVAAGGIALVLGPWLVRLARDLGAERRERVRQEERAEMAAHLHDGVLQTLALIQRSDDPKRMVTLARAQERALRGWLYEPASEGPDTLAAALEEAAARVEQDLDVPVEVVTVGDLPLDDGLRALVSAAGEAMANAGQHSGAPRVSVYLEAGAGAVDIWIGDQGKGFDPATVPADRRGIAESIVGRMERHGGVATITSEPGEGTEVHLRLERP